MSAFELRCRECGKSYGNIPQSICHECFSPLEVFYDYEALRPTFTRERIAAGPASMWRYSDLLPLPDGYKPALPTGFTPLLNAPSLGAAVGSKSLYLKNDAVCMPSLSFKDRVVSVALAQARAFGFEVVSCSSTGNLGNAVAAHAARNGFQAWIFIPADLEPAKIVNTQVYGAKLVRIAGNYDQVNRLCSEIAGKYGWGFVNVNLRPYYAEGSKSMGFEILEQLGWQVPRHTVVPMASGSLLTKITKAGQTINGRRLNEDTFSVQLIDDRERLLSIDKAAINNMAVETKSTMTRKLRVALATRRPCCCTSSGSSGVASCSLFCTCTCEMSGLVPCSKNRVIVMLPSLSLSDEKYSR